MSKVKHHSAFTLIELLVVISIIALLIGILLPALGAARDSGRTTQCLANMRTNGQATATYAAENNDFYPIGRHTSTSDVAWRGVTWATTLAKTMDMNNDGANSGNTVSNRRPFQCPVVKDGRNSPTANHYGAHPRMFPSYTNTAATKVFTPAAASITILKKPARKHAPA